MKDKEGNFVDYAEVRCDFFDEADNFWRVDAWKTDDDNEEGKVVAYVHGDTGDSVICEPLAHLSQKVKEILSEKKKEILDGKDSKTQEESVVVKYKVTGYFEAIVPKNQPMEDIVNAGNEAWSFADFGQLRDIDGVETEDGEELANINFQHSGNSSKNNSKSIIK